MTVDGSAIADRLRPLVAGRPGAAELVGQFGPGMSPEHYTVLSIAIVRVLAAPEAR